MTIFGWDTSSWDDTPTSLDGLSFFTTKLTDGDHWYSNPSAAAKLVAERDLGCPVLGAYHVLWGNQSIANQAAWYLQLLDARVPWWRDFPYWIAQSDNEPFGYNVKPTIAQINEWHDRVIALSGGKLLPGNQFGYTPAWSYGTGVAQQRYPWWQSSYVSGSGPYRTLYPGDASVRWSASGRRADLLQYTSSAVIAGQTTSDANAFAGTLDQLKARLHSGTPAPPNGGDGMANIPQEQWDALIYRDDAYIHDRPAVAGGPYEGEENKLHTHLVAIDTQLAEIKAKIAAPATVDTAALAAALLADPAFAEALATAAFEGAQRAEKE